MSARSIHVFLSLVALSLALAGCGTPSATDICEDIDDDCDSEVPYDECADEGERLTELATQMGCDDVMETYLECLDEDICAWQVTCDAEADALDKCVGRGL
jgi:hypothetical protein